MRNREPGPLGSKCPGFGFGFCFFLEKPNANPECVVLFQLVELPPEPPDLLCHPYKENTQFFPSSSELPRGGFGDGLSQCLSCHRWLHFSDSSIGFL